MENKGIFSGSWDLLKRIEKSSSQRTLLREQQNYLELALLRFLLLAHNDACHVQRSLRLLNEESVQKMQTPNISELVFWRLNLPFFVLSAQIAKNTILQRSILQRKIAQLFPEHVLRVIVFNTDTKLN